MGEDLDVVGLAVQLGIRWLTSFGTLLLGTVLHVPAASSETIVLAPVSECQWIGLGRIDNPNAICPSLDTRQQSRAALVFDLTGIDALQISSLVLELVPVQSLDGEGGLFVGDIEAVALDDSSPLDPFIHTLSNPEITPCAPTGCSVRFIARVDNPASGDGRYEFSRTISEGFPRIPADVSSANIVLGRGDATYLQLSLIPSVGFTGVQFGHSGFADLRLAPATLTVTVVPEPSTGLLLGVGLVILSFLSTKHRKCKVVIA